MLQGIILAAGRGSRLGYLTKPKSFNKSGDKRYIDIIINNFIKNNIRKINIVVGYKKHLFKNFPYKKIINKEWRSSNIFFSLNKQAKFCGQTLVLFLCRYYLRSRGNKYVG